MLFCLLYLAHSWTVQCVTVLFFRTVYWSVRKCRISFGCLHRLTRWALVGLCMALRPVHKPFQATKLCSEVSELAFLKIHFLAFFLQGCGRVFSIVIADRVNVLQSGICFCFLFLDSAGTCLELPLAGHHELQTVIYFCCVLKLSKLEARFEARDEAGWVGRHVERTEAGRTWDIELLRSPLPHMHTPPCTGQVRRGNAQVWLCSHYRNCKWPKSWTK